jgi:hypothetical protein
LSRHRKRSSPARPSPAQPGLLPVSRPATAAIAAALAYGGGLWLHLLHEAEGAVEHDAPGGLLHWLRDSTLTLPLTLLAVWVGSVLVGRLVERHGARAPRALVGAVLSSTIALYASLLVTLGNPVHGLLFEAGHGGHELPFALHMLRDGLLALTANLAVGAAAVAILLARPWVARRIAWPSLAAVGRVTARGLAVLGLLLPNTLSPIATCRPAR